MYRGGRAGGKIQAKEREHGNYGEIGLRYNYRFTEHLIREMESSTTQISSYFSTLQHNIDLVTLSTTLCRSSAAQFPTLDAAQVITHLADAYSVAIRGLDTLAHPSETLFMVQNRQLPCSQTRIMTGQSDPADVEVVRSDGSNTGVRLFSTGTLPPQACLWISRRPSTACP